MARLHEYHGKAILTANGFKIPRGRAASTAGEAVAAAKELTAKKSDEVVIKIQAWRSLDLAGTDIGAASVDLCEMLMRLANVLATALEPAVLRNSLRLTFIVSGHPTRTKSAAAGESEHKLHWKCF